jgi:hypothetical protein
VNGRDEDQEGERMDEEPEDQKGISFVLPEKKRKKRKKIFP